MASSNDTTLYIVAYDIPVDKRRTKVHKLLCGFGQWTQYSLFECWLTKKQLLELRHRLDKLLDAQTDSVRFYPLCAACSARVQTVGGARPADAVVIIV
jgi:CRISPR-associated protein Cas2